MQHKIGKLTPAAAAASIVLLCAGLSACHRQSAAALMEEAKQYQQKGDDKSAIIQLKNAVQKEPENAEARFMLADVDLDFGDPVSAEKEIRKAMSLGIKADRSFEILAKSMLQQGQAQKLLDEIKTLDAKNSALISTLQGDALLSLGRSIEAKAAYDNALALKPNDANVLIGMGRYAFAQHDIEGASHFAEAAVSANPGDPDAWLFKGDLLRTQRQIEPAMAAYDHALSIKPNLRAAHFAKAYLEISTEKFDAAQADINAVKKAGPSNLTATYLQAVLDYSREKYPAATDSLQKVLRVAPEHMPSILLSASVEYKTNALKQAEEHLIKYLEKYPDSSYARKLMASTLLKAHRPADAVEALKPLLAGTSKDPQLLALAGEAYMQTHDYNKANSYFEQASALAPQVGMLHTYIGLSKLGQGESDQAINELEQSAKMDAKSAKAGYVLVLTEIRLKHYDQALAALKDLEKEQPNNPLLHNLEGGAYLGKNDVASARASFEKAVSMDPGYFVAITNLAQLDIREKKPDAAKKRFEALLTKDKKNIPAMVSLAQLAASQGHQDEATTWLERANTENPDEVAPAIQLSMQYLRTGQKQKALTLARKYQVANPTNPGLLDTLGQIEIASKDPLAALETYSKLAALVPNSAPAQLRLAGVHSLLKNDTAAAEDLKKALQLQPDYLQAELATALLAMRDENPDLAMGIAHQLQKQHADLPVGYILEGDVLVSQKKPDQALRAYDHAFQLSKTTPIFVKVHNMLRQMGQTKEADQRMAAWQKDHPNDLQTMLYISENSLADKQFKAAIDQLQAVLKLAPQNAIALNNLAWAYQQQKDPRALATAEQALQLADGNPVIEDTLGWILVEQGNMARAMPLLKKAATAAPDDLGIHFHLASGLAKSGDKADAKRELEQMLAAGKSFPEEAQARALLKQL